ncbi:MAG: DUF2911 domain-containing protein [Candidatus Sulfotelmatobacter sp.]
MFRARLVFYIFFFMVFAMACWAQQDDQSVASCNLDDGKQIAIRYNPVTTKKERVANGKPWEPGGAPMTLFTDTPLTFGGTAIPAGAYTLYPIPGKEWTLVVNKNVAPHSSYDEKQDLARSQVETDQVPDASDDLEVAFAHVGEKCTLRIYFGKAAVFAPFTAKSGS